MGNCIAFCCCSAVTSIFSSCCGTEKPSTVPPSAQSGRFRSILLLLLSIIIAIAFQYGLGPFLFKQSSFFTGFLWDIWGGKCETMFGTDELIESCAGNSGVFRAASSAFFFFCLSSLIALCKPTANREAWCAKYTLFILVTVGTVFIPTDPFFDPIMLNIFRVGGSLFVIGQTIIILDAAFNLNESWVEKSNEADLEEGDGAGKKWLIALLLLSGLLFIASITAIGLMFAYFSGCRTNIVFITLTLSVGIICTGIQLSTGEASLCTSAAVFTYATYLCYTAVSKNPEAKCNPSLGEEDILGIVIGIAITVMSLMWVGFSTTSYRAIGDESNSNEEVGATNQEVQGIRIGAPSEDDEEAKEEDGTDSKTFSNSWKLNLILATVCCWYAMSLTSWGSIQQSGDLANPSVGKISMWMIIASQWLMYLMYLWTLSAPSLFPDRDFS